MESKNSLYDLLKKEEDGTYSIAVAQRNSIGVNGWLKYLEENNIFFDNETEDILKLEFVPTSGEKRIRIVPSSFPDGVDNENICHENLKKLSKPTAEVHFIFFKFFYEKFYKGKEYKYPPVLLLSKSGSLINAYMRLGENTLKAFFFQERTS